MEKGEDGGGRRLSFDDGSDKADSLTSEVEVEQIASVKENYLFDQLLKLFGEEGHSTCSVQQKINLERLQRNINYKPDDKTKGLRSLSPELSSTDVLLLDDPFLLAKLKSIQDLARYLNSDEGKRAGTVIAVLLNEREAVYILPSNTETFAADHFLPAAGGTSLELMITPNEDLGMTLTIYAPDSESAQPTVSALLQLASKSEQTRRLDIEAGWWRDSEKDDPIDLPLQTSTFEGFPPDPYSLAE